jgi:hypothetical protein
MSDKVYEMYEDYKNATEALLGYIGLRDLLVKSLKTAPPHQIPETRQLISEFDVAIEKCEAALAKEFESYQTMRRKEDELDEMMDVISERLVMTYIFVKHRMPEKLDELTAVCLNNYTPEEKQAFHDRVAILEADKTEFEKIIAREK